MKVFVGTGVTFAPAGVVAVGRFKVSGSRFQDCESSIMSGPSGVEIGVGSYSF